MVKLQFRHVFYSICSRALQAAITVITACRALLLLLLRLVVSRHAIFNEDDFSRIYATTSSTGLLFFLYQFFIISTVDRSMIQDKEFIYSHMTVRIYFSRTPHLDQPFLVSVFLCVFSYIIIISMV
jgi:hypothetical protein